jgi:hypothetical protein
VKAYFFKILLTALAVFVVYFAILYWVRSPISAEYWVREMIVVKQQQLAKIPGPRIIVVGGSNVLYNIDAAAMEKELKVPSYNFGLHAGMRVDWMIETWRAAVKPGDVVVMALEQPCYTQGPGWGDQSPAWAEWGLRNAIAWCPQEFDRLGIVGKTKAICSGGTLDMARELVKTKWVQKFYRKPPSYLSKRLQALEPDDQILARFASSRARSEPFPFYQFIDDRGTVMQPDTNEFKGKFVSVTIPSAIHPYTRRILTGFLAEMKERQVRVFFANSPYGMDGPVNAGWEEAEREFQREIHALGAEVLDRREQLFFPSNLFYNTNLHLNKSGKEARTKILIDALRQKLRP